MLPSLGITLFLQPAIKILLLVSIIQLFALWYLELPSETFSSVMFGQLPNVPCAIVAVSSLTVYEPDIVSVSAAILMCEAVRQRNS